MSLAADIRASQNDLTASTITGVEAVRSALTPADRDDLDAALADPTIDDEAIVAVLLTRGHTGLDSRAVARYRRSLP